MTEKRISYVYEYFVIETGEVFYVGKGYGKRVFAEGRNLIFNFIKNNCETDVRIYKEKLTDSEACNIETERIGELVKIGQAVANLTPGGDGIVPRSSVGKIKKTYEGKHITSAPLGYDKDSDGKLIINKEKAEIIKLIFNRVLNGYGINYIAKELNESGYVTGRNGKFTSAHISSLIRNPVYYGCLTYNKSIQGEIVDTITVSKAHKAIISKEEFLKVQKQLEQSNNKHSRIRVNITRILQGMIICDNCNKKRYIQMDGSGKDYIKYCRCNDAGFGYKKLEDEVFNTIKRSRPDIIEELNGKSVTAKNAYLRSVVKAIKFSSNNFTEPNTRKRENNPTIKIEF